MSRSICVTANGSATKTAEVGEFIATVSFLVGSNPADYPANPRQSSSWLQNTRRISRRPGIGLH